MKTKLSLENKSLIFTYSIFIIILLILYVYIKHEKDNISNIEYTKKWYRFQILKSQKFIKSKVYDDVSIGMTQDKIYLINNKDMSKYVIIKLEIKNIPLGDISGNSNDWVSFNAFYNYYNLFTLSSMDIIEWKYPEHWNNSNDEVRIKILQKNGSWLWKTSWLS